MPQRHGGGLGAAALPALLLVLVLLAASLVWPFRRVLLPRLLRACDEEKSGGGPASVRLRTEHEESELGDLRPMAIAPRQEEML